MRIGAVDVLFMHAGEQRLTRHGNMRWWNDVGCQKIRVTRSKMEEA